VGPEIDSVITTALPKRVEHYLPEPKIEMRVGDWTPLGHAFDMLPLGIDKETEDGGQNDWNPKAKNQTLDEGRD
jgi:hypothetical protein